MKTFASLALGLALLGSAGYSGDSGSAAAAEQRVAQTASPFQMQVTGRQSIGQKIRVKGSGGDVETLEAAGAWTAVTVTVRNISGARQAVHDALWFSSAELTDSQGNVHRVESAASAASIDAIELKPMAPGEVRSVKLVFDLPSGTAAGELKISGYDAQRNVQEFRVF
jgi:Domain of unknown function (DUF4352)